MSRHRYIKPSSYDGTTPVEVYITKFNRASVYNHWNETDKVFHLTNLLTGGAELLIDEATELTTTN